MQKIIGIDYGKVRIGLAISDQNHIIAFPLKCVQANRDPNKTIQELSLFLSTLDIEKIVLGLPLLFNGKDSELTKDVRLFASRLEAKTGKSIILWDERLTSKQAEKFLIESNVRRKERTRVVDTMAATLILQSYLDSQFKEK